MNTPATAEPSARFHFAAFVLSCLYALLVFCQLGTHSGAYPSDLVLHVDFALHPDASPAAGYSLLHTLCGAMLKASGLTNPAEARLFVSGAMLALLVAAFYGSLIAVHEFFQRMYAQKSPWAMAGCTLAVFLASMIITQPMYPNTYYLGVFTPNPWHNPTYSFGRFFSILAFCQFVRLLASGGRLPPRSLIMLATTLALSVWAKPSFLIGFLPAALVVLAWGWWRRWFGAVTAMGLAAVFAPALLVLAWIDHKVFVAGAGDRVILAPGQGWGLYTPSFTLSIVLGMLFPLYVLAVRWRNWSRLLSVAAASWATSGLAFALLAETGTRAAHANFAWCYMSGMFFLHLAAIGDWFLGTPVANRVLRWIGVALFLLHLGSGLRYFLRLLAGGPYA